MDKKGIELTKDQAEKQRFKIGRALILACFLLYTLSMAAKGIYAAETKFIIDMWDLTQAQAQTANTFYFVTYGIVQVFLFIFMEKINIRKYVIWTVPVACLFTMLMGFATRIQGMWIFFGINGVFQAGIFCGCNYVLTRYLPKALLTKANQFLSMGYAVGTVIAYSVSAIFIGSGLWQIPYFLISAIFFLSLVYFVMTTIKSIQFEQINLILDRKSDENSIKDHKKVENTDYPIFTIDTKKKKTIFYIIDLSMAFLMTALYYSIMNFLTSILVEVHGMSQDISIYIAVLVPISIVAGPLMTIRACDKHKDFIKQAIIFTFMILPIPILLAFLYDVNVIIFLILTIAFLILANGIKSIVLSIMAFKLKGILNVAAYSAISNASASLAAGVVPVIIGAIKDNFGWQATYWTIFVTIIVILALLIIIDIWVRRMYKKDHNITLKDN